MAFEMRRTYTRTHTGPNSEPVLGKWNGAAVSLSHGCWGRSGSFYTLLPALPPQPQPLQLEWMSLWRIHIGDDKNLSMSPEGDKVGCPSGKSHTSAMFSGCPQTWTMCSHPQLRGRSEGIRKYALKIILYTDWKPQKLVKTWWSSTGSSSQEDRIKLGQPWLHLALG